MGFASGKKDLVSFAELEKKYPSSEYFMAVGQGASLANAQSSAKLSLCQSLGESLSGNQNTSQFENSAGDKESSLSVSVMETVVFENVWGIQLKEHWQPDSSKSLWYSVAVLNKKEAGQYYARLISDEDSKIQKLVSAAEKNMPSFESLSFMDQAVRAAEENQYNLNILKAINLNQARVVFLSYESLQNIYLQQKKMASELKVNIIVDNDRNDQVLGAFTSALAEKGVAVYRGQGQFIIKANVSMEPVNQKIQDGTVAVRFLVTGSVTDLASGNVVKSINYSGREGHITVEQAEARCFRRIASLIQDDF